MDLISFVLLVIVIILPAIPLLEKYRKWRKIVEAVDVYDGDKYYPIIGTTLTLLKAGRNNFWKIYHERTERYGPIFRSWIGTRPVIHLKKAEHIEVVLKSSEHVNKGTHYKLLEPWFGNGLLTSAEKQWRVHRKLINPTFHTSILENFSEIFAMKSQMLADKILPFANGKEFDIYPYLTLCSLDIICETAMGVKINALDNSESEYVKALFGALEKIIERMFNTIYRNDFIYSLTESGRSHKNFIDTLHRFTEKIVREREKQMADQKLEHNQEEQLLGLKRKPVFLDLLLEINKQSKEVLSFQDIREEVDTFMFAGHDSSTVTASWVIFLLGNYPDVQEKVYEELEGIFHGEERPVTPQDLLQMKYLERVIKESMRLFSVVPVVTRTLTKEIVLDGHTIPPGVSIVIHIFELHRDPKQFPNPEHFDPDRFLPENVQGRHPYAYIPFSAGPRNCVGQKFAMRSTKTVIATLIRKYKVRSLKKPEEVECFFEIVLRPQGGLPVTLEVRNKL